MSVMSARYEAQQAAMPAFGGGPDAMISVRADQLFALLNLVRMDREVYEVPIDPSEMHSCCWHSARVTWHEVVALFGGMTE